MTEDEAIEDIVGSVVTIHNGHVTRGSAESLRKALRDFAQAIEKRVKAEVACTLLTRETEAMGGYG